MDHPVCPICGEPVDPKDEESMIDLQVPPRHPPIHFECWSDAYND